MDWIYLAQDKDQGWAVVKTSEILVSIKCREFVD